MGFRKGAMASRLRSCMARFHLDYVRPAVLFVVPALGAVTIVNIFSATSVTAHRCSRFLNASNIALAFTNILRLLWLVGAALFQTSLAGAITRATASQDDQDSNSGGVYSRPQSFQRLDSANQGKQKAYGGAPARDLGLLGLELDAGGGSSQEASSRRLSGAESPTEESAGKIPSPLSAQGIETMEVDPQDRLERGDAEALHGRMTDVVDRATEGGKREGAGSNRRTGGPLSEVDADLAAGQVVRGGDDSGEITPALLRRLYKRWIWWKRLGHVLLFLQLSALVCLAVAFGGDLDEKASPECPIQNQYRGPDEELRALVLSCCLISLVALIVQFCVGSEVIVWRRFYGTQDVAWRAHYKEVFDASIREALCCTGRVERSWTEDDEELEAVASLLGDVVAYRAVGASHLELFAGLALLQNEALSKKTPKYRRMQSSTVTSFPNALKAKLGAHRQPGRQAYQRVSQDLLNGTDARGMGQEKGQGKGQEKGQEKEQEEGQEMSMEGRLGESVSAFESLQDGPRQHQMTDSPQISVSQQSSEAQQEKQNGVEQSHPQGKSRARPPSAEGSRSNGVPLAYQPLAPKAPWATEPLPPSADSRGMLSGNVDPALLQDASYLLQVAIAAYTGPLLDMGRYPFSFPLVWPWRQGLFWPWRNTHLPDLEGDNAWKGHAAAFLTYLGLPPSALKKARVKQGSAQAVYFLAVLHERRQVVVAVRGTESPEDAIIDGLGRESPMEPGDDFLRGIKDELQNYAEVTRAYHMGPRGLPYFGHSGVLAAARNLAAELDGGDIPVSLDGHFPQRTGSLNSAGLLTKLLGPGGECEGYDLRIVGHSMGGAVASLTGLQLRERYPTLRVYGYGSMPCVDAITADACSSFITTFVYNDEFAPRISVASVMRLRADALRAVARQSRAAAARGMPWGRGWAGEWRGRERGGGKRERSVRWAADETGQGEGERAKGAAQGEGKGGGEGGRTGTAQRESDVPGRSALPTDMESGQEIGKVPPVASLLKQQQMHQEQEHGHGQGQEQGQEQDQGQEQGQGQGQGHREPAKEQEQEREGPGTGGPTSTLGEGTEQGHAEGNCEASPLGALTTVLDEGSKNVDSAASVVLSAVHWAGDRLNNIGNLMPVSWSSQGARNRGAKGGGKVPKQWENLGLPATEGRGYFNDDLSSLMDYARAMGGARPQEWIQHQNTLKQRRRAQQGAPGPHQGDPGGRKGEGGGRVGGGGGEGSGTPLGSSSGTPQGDLVPSGSSSFQVYPGAPGAVQRWVRRQQRHVQGTACVASSAMGCLLRSSLHGHHQLDPALMEPLTGAPDSSGGVPPEDPGVALLGQLRQDPALLERRTEHVLDIEGSHLERELDDRKNGSKATCMGVGSAGSVGSADGVGGGSGVSVGPRTGFEVGDSAVEGGAGSHDDSSADMVPSTDEGSFLRPLPPFPSSAPSIPSMSRNCNGAASLATGEEDDGYGPGPGWQRGVSHRNWEGGEEEEVEDEGGDLELEYWAGEVFVMGHVVLVLREGGVAEKEWKQASGKEPHAPTPPHSPSSPHTHFHTHTCTHNQTHTHSDPYTEPYPQNVMGPHSLSRNDSYADQRDPFERSRDATGSTCGTPTNGTAQLPHSDTGRAYSDTERVDVESRNDEWGGVRHLWGRAHHRAVTIRREWIRDLVVSPSVLLDHLPWRLAHALDELLRKELQQKKRRNEGKAVEGDSSKRGPCTCFQGMPHEKAS